MGFSFDFRFRARIQAQSRRNNIPVVREAHPHITSRATGMSPFLETSMRQDRRMDESLYKNHIFASIIATSALSSGRNDIPVVREAHPRRACRATGMSPLLEPPDTFSKSTPPSISQRLFPRPELFLPRLHVLRHFGKTDWSIVRRIDADVAGEGS